MGNMEFNSVNHPYVSYRQKCNLTDVSSIKAPEISADSVDNGTVSTSKQGPSLSVTDQSLPTSTMAMEGSDASSNTKDFNINTLDPDVLGKHGGEFLAEY